MLRGDMRGFMAGVLGTASGTRTGVRSTTTTGAAAALMALLALAAGPAAAETVLSGVPAVKNIRAGSHPDRLRIVLDASDGVEFQARLEADGSRLVVDLPGAVWTAADTGRFARGLGASSWTAEPGRHSVRLTVELAQPARTLSTVTLPGREGGSRLVIDLAPATAPAAPRVADAAAPEPAPRAKPAPVLVGDVAAGTVVATDLTPRPRTGAPKHFQVASRLVRPEPADPTGVTAGFGPGLASTLASGGFAVSLGFVPSETALRLGMAPEKPEDAPGGGNPLEGRASTSLMGSAMDMDWGFENGSFAVKMSGPGDGDLQLASRLRFRDKSLTLGVLMPF